MLDDIALVLASVGTATGTVALLRRRMRRPPLIPRVAAHGAGARHLADVLCAADAEPLELAGPRWRSLAETVQPGAPDRLS